MLVGACSLMSTCLRYSPASAENAEGHTNADTVVVSTINDADQLFGDVILMTPRAACEKSECLGSGGSMVARLKLEEIDGGAPPGVNRSPTAANYWLGSLKHAEGDCMLVIARTSACMATLSKCGNTLRASWYHPRVRKGGGGTSCPRKR